MLNEEDMTQEDVKRRIIKNNILHYIKTNLKYYVKRDDLKKEEDKIYAALKDLFTNVPLDQMGDYNRFCENGRFLFLMRKSRIRWGEKFLIDINDIIVKYAATD
jgi:hypothetical protein